MKVAKLKRIFPYIILISLFLFQSLNVYPQIINNILDGNQNAPGSHWRVIHSPRFNLVFPLNISPDAQRVANTMEYIYDSIAKTLNFTPKKITLVLTNQTTIPNGFVTTIPRYSQWFGTPPQISFGGAVEWYQMLASHETRHIIQIDKFRSTGLNPVLHFLFGQTVFSALMNFSVPGWFFEGDAVGTETALSSGGRGRLPEFDRDIRTLLLSGKRYNYTKAYMNSVKDYYPSIYELGYLMTTHVKRKNGPKAWSNVLRTASKIEYLPFSFGIATGINVKASNKRIYINTMNELENLWKEQLKELKFTAATKVNHKEKKSWTNYEFPQYAGDGSVICYKWGKDDIIKIIRIDQEGRETFLCYGPQYSGIPFTVTGHYISWNEYRWDARWGQQDYSIIRVYDMNTKKTKTITHRSKLFSPVISPDLNRIAAVEFTQERKCALVILDLFTGKVLKRFDSYQNEFIELPSWSPDASKIVYTRTSISHGKFMEIVEYETGNTIDVLPNSFENFSRPVYARDYIFYNSPFSGIDNIYAISLKTHKQYQVSSRKFSSTNASVSPDGLKMLFNDYSVDGFDILEMPLITDSFRLLKEVEQRSIKYWEPLVRQESGGDIFKNIPKKDFKIDKYKAGLHFFNIHSWALVPSLANGTAISASFNSLNYLNTMMFRVGYEHNINEKTNAFFANGAYAGLYPIIDFGGIIGGRTSYYLTNDTANFYNWKEKSAYLGLRIPLNLSRSVWSQGLTLSVTGKFTHITDYTAKVIFTDMRNIKGNLIPVNYKISYQRAIQGAKDFNPKWGQFLNLTYTHTPLGGDYTGKFISGNIDLYFPGFIRHHSLLLQAAAEYQETDDVTFASEILFFRGYAFENFDKTYKAGINYAFPLWYPDFHIGPILNFRQVKVNLFDDYGRGYYNLSGTETSKDFNSTGIEISVSTNFLHIAVPIDIGVRYSYLSTIQKSAFEFLVFGMGL